MKKEKKYMTKVKESLLDDFLELKLIDPLFNIYVITKFKPISDVEVEKAVVEKLFNFSNTNKLQILSDDKEKNIDLNSFLNKIGFKIQKKKLFYEKFLINHSFNYEDIFEYKSIRDIGEDKFITVFDEATKGDKERDEITGFTYYQAIKEDANKTFSPDRWKVVILKDNIIGMIMPQVFWDIPEEGSVFHIGVLPKYRNKGYGKMLHSKCLELLKNEGVKRYVGSTLEENIAMNKVFEKNDCIKKMTRFFYSLN